MTGPSKVSLCLIFRVLAPDLALAETPVGSPPAPARPDATHETALVGGLGYAAGETAGGVALSLAVLHDIGFVEIGAELYGATALTPRLGALGGVVGIRLGSELSVRALAAGGVHAYGGVGSGLLSGDPGVSGSSPYVGGRFVLGYAFPGRSHVFLGIGALVDEDLTRQEESVTYVATSWFGGEPSEATNRHTIGQTTFGVLILVGREFDLAAY